MNPNYVDINLKAQKSATKSHFKFYQRLMELRKQETFQYGDIKIQALNQNVFAFVRDLLDKDSYVVVINLGANNEDVSLKSFSTLRDKLKVVASSPASSYEEGYVLKCFL
jgi:alpha-glucosidase